MSPAVLFRSVDYFRLIGHRGSFSAFLAQFEATGKYVGMNQIGFRYQKLENKSFRRSLGLPDTKSGILVTEVAPTGPWGALLKSGDVVLSCDGARVWNDGTVEFRG